MQYEIVTLNEKIMAGFSGRTNNTSPDMSRVISGLWQRLYAEHGCMKLKNRVNDKAMGIYTDYAGDHLDDYTVFVGCEVSDTESVPNEMQTLRIPAGQYAKFIIYGNMVTAVSDFWQELWKMNLNRSFICDFEEYQNADPEHAEIHIYIGLK